MMWFFICELVVVLFVVLGGKKYVFLRIFFLENKFYFYVFF